jgi:hypothetical protein
MPIKKFEIRNIGPIKYAKIEDVPSIVIIAGPNGVGKSTLLEALKKRQGTVSIEITGKLVYVAPYRTPIAFQLHKSLPFLGPDRKYIDVLASDSFSLGAPGISLPHYISSGTQRTKTTPDFAPYVEAKYKLAQFKHKFEQAVTEIFRKFDGKKLDEVMPKDIYSPFREFVKSLLPGLRFDDVVLEGNVYKINFANRANTIVEFDQLSSGEKDIIAILFPFVEKEIENELARAKAEKIPHEDITILIDSPEAYLHPTLQRNLLEYLRKSVRDAESRGERLQFIIATHSTTIINEATPEDLYVMVFPDQTPNGNQIIKITMDEDKLHLIREILGDVGYLASGKPILLVESKNDADILNLLMPDIKEKFTLLFLDGKDKILKFVESFNKVAPELIRRGFKMYALVDKDREQVMSKNYCFFWPRACIENFLLLDSEAIYEALRVIAGDTKLHANGVKSKEDIDCIINEIINDPKIIDYEFKERIKLQLKFYIGENWESLDNLKEAASKTLTEKLKRVEKQYETLKNTIKQIICDKEKALTELNGKIILGKIASKFNVKRDELAKVIADKLITLNRVPQEITNLFRQIEGRVFNITKR